MAFVGEVTRVGEVTCVGEVTRAREQVTDNNRLRHYPKGKITRTEVLKEADH